MILCGHIRRLTGDLEGAERDLDRAVRMSNRRPEAYIHRAWLRLDQTRVVEGLGDAIHARELLSDGDKLLADVNEILDLLQNQLGNRSLQ